MPHLLTHCPSAQPILAPVTSPTPPKQRAQASTPPLLKCHPGSLPSPDQLLSGHEHSRSSNAPPPDAHQQATQGVHTHTKTHAGAAHVISEQQTPSTPPSSLSPTHDTTHPAGSRDENAAQLSVGDLHSPHDPHPFFDHFPTSFSASSSSARCPPAPRHQRSRSSSQVPLPAKLPHLAAFAPNNSYPRLAAGAAPSAAITATDLPPLPAIAASLPHPTWPSPPAPAGAAAPLFSSHPSEDVDRVSMHSLLTSTGMDLSSPVAITNLRRSTSSPQCPVAAHARLLQPPHALRSPDAAHSGLLLRSPTAALSRHTTVSPRAILTPLPRATSLQGSRALSSSGLPLPVAMPAPALPQHYMAPQMNSDVLQPGTGPASGFGSAALLGFRGKAMGSSQMSTGLSAVA
ncbi:MAG: hypothetical protein WDW36_004917 [Sanguina aurantia]